MSIKNPIPFCRSLSSIFFNIKSAKSATSFLHHLIPYYFLDSHDGAYRHFKNNYARGFANL
jgi:hypothetical protein